MTAHPDRHKLQERPDEEGVPRGRDRTGVAPDDTARNGGSDLSERAVAASFAAWPPNERHASTTEGRHGAPRAVALAPADLFRKAFGWRHAALLAACTLLAAAAAAGAAAVLVVPLYGARSEILLNTSGVDWSNADRFLATQTVIATGRSILEPVAAGAEVPLEQLDARLSVEVVGRSSVLRFQYADADQRRALRVLGDITSRYLTALRELERTAGTSHVVLTPPYLLERPVAPRPLRSAALGAVAGFALTASSLVVGAWMRAKR